MGNYKDAFLASLENEEDPNAFEFGPPATEAEIARLEEAYGTSLPPELREMLSEFNGVTRNGNPEDFCVLPSGEMNTIIETYRNWDWPTDKLLARSSNIAYVLLLNGNAEMAGVVVKPFGPYQRGQVVGFDHDYIMDDADEPQGLFGSHYGSLLELLAASYVNTVPDDS